MIHRCIKLLLGLLALKIHARNMKVHYINSYEEIDRIRPTLVLVMAGFKNEHETWCGDTNRALKNIELMKNDPKFLWHKLAVIESSRAVWRSEDDSRLSRKKLSESRLGVTNVPTLLKWKEPEIRLVEADMYLGSNRERSENYGYRHIEYMLMTGHAPSDLSYQPIQMNIDYVFKLADVDRFNPSVVYFKAIYNPGYGKAWDNEVNRYAVRINQMVVDEKFKDHRLVICSIFRNDWYGSDNEYRKGDLGVTLYSASTLMRWNERGYFMHTFFRIWQDFLKF